jgi:hypothetical protein
MGRKGGHIIRKRVPASLPVCLTYIFVQQPPFIHSQALREGRLDSAARCEAGGVWGAAATFHTGAMYLFARSWHDGKLTMAQSGKRGCATACCVCDHGMGWVVHSVQRL